MQHYTHVVSRNTYNTHTTQRQRVQVAAAAQRGNVRQLLHRKRFSVRRLLQLTSAEMFVNGHTRKDTACTAAQRGLLSLYYTYYPYTTPIIPILHLLSLYYT
jgi:hypothetical protein